MNVVGDAGFTRNASTLWAAEYDQVVFRSRDELHERVRHFLRHDADRAAITRDMRQRVLETMTYKAIARQTIDFVARDLASGRASVAA